MKKPNGKGKYSLYSLFILLVSCTVFLFYSSISSIHFNVGNDDEKQPTIPVIINEVKKDTPDLVSTRNVPDNQKTLAEIISKPEVIVQNNLLSYQKYGIIAPLIYSSDDEVYLKKPDGSFDKSQFIPEDPENNDHLAIPLQRLLVKGVVHIASTPEPGELATNLSSYIVGHSSNYPSVKSDYNTIFKPLESISQPGEEFTIFDKDGRELKFKVFETLKIAEEDSNEAYKAFPGRRVVTLQTSILGYKNGKYGAISRWLTRGELFM
jgi:hypothetical protein